MHLCIYLFIYIYIYVYIQYALLLYHHPYQCRRQIAFFHCNPTSPYPYDHHQSMNLLN